MAADLAGPVRVSASGTLVDLRVIPRSPRAALDGVREGRLLRVTAPPVEQAANDAVVRLLADVLDVPKSAIAIASGTTSRNKTARVGGLTFDQVRARLAAAAR
jgi:uncharacterized protein YggU (UPF0235/DUF167 family)